MIEIRETREFSQFVRSLRDPRARARIVERVQRLAFGNPEDVAPIGQGVSEMRIHYGPGYRVHYTRRGAELIILLCAGIKKTQTEDIEIAKTLASEIAEVNL